MVCRPARHQRPCRTPDAGTARVWSERCIADRWLSVTSETTKNRWGMPAGGSPSDNRGALPRRGRVARSRVAVVAAAPPVVG
jgi:hypothetical protein